MPMYKTSGVKAFRQWDNQSVEKTYSYDSSGNVLIDNSEYTIDNVVSYYRTPLLNMCTEISALSSDWQNVIFLTDTHGSANKQHSQAMAIYMLEHVSNIDFIHLNGDYSNDPFDLTQYNAFMAPFLSRKTALKTYAAHGNHETYGNQASFAKPTIADDFLYPKDNLHGNLEKTYYYFDNVDKKTRWMVINTSDSSAYSVSSEQLGWISDNVTLPASDWHLVVIGHVNLWDCGGITTQNENGATSIINAILSTNGNLVGYICGHQHIDHTGNTGQLQQMTLMCDRFENTNYYDGLSYTERVADTVNEQALTVLSLNTNTRSVVARRIGAGWSDIVAGLHYTY